MIGFDSGEHSLRLRLCGHAISWAAMNRTVYNLLQANACELISGLNLCFVAPSMTHSPQNPTISVCNECAFNQRVERTIRLSCGLSMLESTRLQSSTSGRDATTLLITSLASFFLYSRQTPTFSTKMWRFCIKVGCSLSPPAMRRWQQRVMEVVKEAVLCCCIIDCTTSLECFASTAITTPGSLAA